MKKAIFVLLMLVAAFALFGCINPPQPPVNQTNQTMLTADYGDNASVDYTLLVDGKVTDTSIESVARNNSIYTPFRTYAPLQVQLLLGPENPIIPGFVKGIVGMQVNETKYFEVAPADGYGAYNSTLTYNVSHYYNKSAFEEVPRAYFTERNITVEEGVGFDTEQGKVFIYNFTADTVTIMYIFQLGDTFNYNGFHHVVVGSNNMTYNIMLDVRENGTYNTISPITGNPSSIRVTKLTNETMTMDENSPLAGKPLAFNVTLRDLKKAE